MQNNTNITLEKFKSGKSIDMLVIDPESERNQEFFRPDAGGMRLYALSTTGSKTQEKDTLDEVTTDKQFQALIERIKSGGYGKVSNKDDVVIVELKALEI